MMPTKFRKKPVVIEAAQHTGNEDACREIHSWMGIEHGDGSDSTCRQPIFIGTLEGLMQADVGDWIIRGVKGEFYPCKPDIFTATYEVVES
ncbi:MAG: hypothetical protein K0S70_154 [Microbacterium sp.]|jgi:hypothetical protein|nr:hypothetical protein [Microbacterium sp.]